LLCDTSATALPPMSLTVAPFATVSVPKVKTPTTPAWWNAMPAATSVFVVTMLAARVKAPLIAPLSTLMRVSPAGNVIAARPAMLRSVLVTGVVG
jgi:hypothetical protein